MDEDESLGRLPLEYIKATGEVFSLNIFGQLPEGWNFEKLRQELKKCIEAKKTMEENNIEWKEFMEERRKFCRENPDILI